MKKLTVITGGTPKQRQSIANSLLQAYDAVNTVHVDCNRIKKPNPDIIVAHCSESTELLVVHNVPANITAELLSSVFSVSLAIRHRHHRLAFTIPTPKVIVTTDSAPELTTSTMRRVELVRIY